MTMQIPGKMKKGGAPQDSLSRGEKQIRQKKRGASESPKGPGLKEDDLDHLGSVHKRSH